MADKVIKRDGSIVDFDEEKIRRAILGAMRDVSEVTQHETDVAEMIAHAVRVAFRNKEEVGIEEIQDLVETNLMKHELFDVAKAYIRYRYDREKARQINTTDEAIRELLDGQSEYWNTENSNKDSKVVTVQRDYIAGITSTDIARRFLLPKDVVEAHDAGIIHQHDMDYLAQSALTNCCLINLEDMLQNGTVINGVTIDPQKRLLTATTVATQIITAVSSSQYGGTTITLTHLAPFVRMSEEYYRKEVEREFEGIEISEEKKEEIIQKRLQKEVSDSVQTFNYQINSMSTCNGQSPFLSVFMWPNEDPEYAKEIVMLIEEFLKQRILGMKNEKGVYVTQAFPKLLYCLDEDNTYKGSRFYWLTELAAKSTAKRMNPDYISAKVMREQKINQYGYGDVYPCMGKWKLAHVKNPLNSVA